VQVLAGVSLSPGYADGPAYILNGRRVPIVAKRPIRQADIEEERRRLTRAIDGVKSEFDLIQRQVAALIGSSGAAVFEAHKALAQDKMLFDLVIRRVETDLVNVEHAVAAELDEFRAKFESNESDYIRARAADVLDVGNRIVQHLAGKKGCHEATVPRGAVVVAREVLPSDTISMNRQNVAAFVTETGSQTSHAAILARSLGIPAVAGIDDIMEVVAEGMRLLVDGERGEITVLPSRRASAGFRAVRDGYERATCEAEEHESDSTQTADGVKVDLHANIGRPSEAALVPRHDLRGVGLFRAEYMFMDEEDQPSFDRHRLAYEEAARALGGRPLVIRTLDLGGDKRPAFLDGRLEANPNLGVRGLRFSLSEPVMFKEQLRAILHVARDNDVRVMFPMVLGPDDLKRAVDEVEALSAEVGARRIPVGAMIETPAAVFSLDGILDLADFVSIGTNDLTQFVLAADRNAGAAADDFSALHPSVLRAVRTVIRAAVDRGKDVSICGEVAGNPMVTPLLVGLGARKLSMSPVRAARVRQAVARTTCACAEGLAESALGATSAAEVKAVIASWDTSRQLVEGSEAKHQNSRSTSRV